MTHEHAVQTEGGREKEKEDRRESVCVRAIVGER
jgi:hypothetical protein